MNYSTHCSIPAYFALQSAAKLGMEGTDVRAYHDHLLLLLLELVGARTIVELGTGPGYGTRAMLGYVQRVGGRLISIDKDPTQTATELASEPHATFLVSDSVTAAWSVDLGVAEIDAVYCDSDHSLGHVYNELTAWEKHKPKLFLVDDTLAANTPHGSPLETLAKFCDERQWPWWNIPLGTGLGVTWNPTRSFT